jgi:hypothetical protein
VAHDLGAVAGRRRLRNQEIMELRSGITPAQQDRLILKVDPVDSLSIGKRMAFGNGDQYPSVQGGFLQLRGDSWTAGLSDVHRRSAMSALVDFDRPLCANSDRSPDAVDLRCRPGFHKQRSSDLVHAVHEAWRSGASGYVNWPASRVSRNSTLRCILDTSRIPVLAIETGDRNRTSS